jgi:hypothetical protein
MKLHSDFTGLQKHLRLVVRDFEFTRVLVRNINIRWERVLKENKK